MMLFYNHLHYAIEVATQVAGSYSNSNFLLCFLCIQCIFVFVYILISTAGVQLWMCNW